MSTRLETAYNVGRSGGKLMWYFNPDHPDAHADAVAEYQRGVAARTCKPGLPVQGETKIKHKCERCDLRWTNRSDVCPNCKRSDASWRPQPGTPFDHFQSDNSSPSRAVPSLSGEFPGLGKWELIRFNEKALLLGVKGFQYAILDIKDRIELSYGYLKKSCDFTQIHDWIRKLSSLPPREVAGDYVVGPHGVKFQVGKAPSRTYPDSGKLYIVANGYRIIWLTDEKIGVEMEGPLKDAIKWGDRCIWPLRGEG